jgi:hypothetical protein
MKALADGRLSPDFVKASKALLRLENSMQREGYGLGLETFASSSSAAWLAHLYGPMGH